HLFEPERPSRHRHVPVERQVVGRRARELSRRDEEQVLPSVAVIVEEGAAAAEGLEEQVALRLAVRVLEPEPGGRRDVLGQARGRGGGTGAGRRGGVGTAAGHGQAGTQQQSREAAAPAGGPPVVETGRGRRVRNLNLCGPTVVRGLDRLPGTNRRRASLPAG